MVATRLGKSGNNLKNSGAGRAHWGDTRIGFKMIRLDEVVVLGMRKLKLEQRKDILLILIRESNSILREKYQEITLESANKISDKVEVSRHSYVDMFIENTQIRAKVFKEIVSEIVLEIRQID